MSGADPRPPVWVGHVVMESDRLEETARFMRLMGLRPVFEGPRVAILELRGGTHLVIVAKEGAALGKIAFDLMVEDLRATHQQFTRLGLAPTPIEAVPDIDHERFQVREPAGHLITVYSNHASGEPV